MPKMIKKHIILSIFIIINTIVDAQVISGTVYDNFTKNPLEGASVYLDGTTIGTVTDSNGHYKLEIETVLNAPVVVSFIGYKTKAFPITDLNALKEIYLDESPNQLDEVLIEADPWSREKKLRIFKSEFLGKTISSKHCRITNEKDISLIYKPSTNTLIAFSEKPLIIKNRYLGYTINYNLIDFEIEFKTSTQGLRYTQKVFSSGTSFFSELHKSPKKKNSLNREKSYYGSRIHFMRALFHKRLSENNFRLYYKRLPIHPYKYFNINTEDNLIKVVMVVENLSVVYNNFHQSSLEFTAENNTFYIDENGNHSPPNGLLFGGDFGQKRVSNMLPLDYNSVIN